MTANGVTSFNINKPLWFLGQSCNVKFSKLLMDFNRCMHQSGYIVRLTSSHWGLPYFFFFFGDMGMAPPLALLHLHSYVLLSCTKAEFFKGQKLYFMQYKTVKIKVRLKVANLY